jgi:hypothetical protein
MIQPLKGKCSHPQCHCTVPGTTAHCSDYCMTAAEGSESCRCGHEECVQASQPQTAEQHENKPGMNGTAASPVGLR